MIFSSDDSNEPKLRWYQGVTPYQWWVFAVGAMAWLFDCADQRLFTMARSPALADLLGRPMTDKWVESMGTYATAATMAGWAAGGLFFGVMGDRWGRVKTLSVSILVYSIFTGLCGLATTGWDFCLYRFLMGSGIGGAFAAGATLVAETMPPHARATCLGLFSALSVLGNMTGLAMAGKLFVPTSRYLQGMTSDGVAGWRMLFFVGALPALMVVIVMRTLHESEQWQAARRTAGENLERQMGDLKTMFRHSRWRRNTIVAVAMATAGIVGVWGVGFWSPELIGHALTPEQFRGQELTQELKQYINNIKFRGNLLQDVGGFLGILAFTSLANRLNRRSCFAVAFLMSFAMVSYVFMTLDTESKAYVLLPIMGFFNLSIMGGFVIYFPEIFPTRLRSTGTAFGYNVARISAAVVMLLGDTIRDCLHQMNVASPFRVGAVVLSGVYFVGLFVLIWAPETRGQPLPEE